MPKLGATGAARLQAWLLQDTIERAQYAQCPIVVWAVPQTNHGQFLRLRRMGIRVRRQPQGQLGRRMLRALRASPTATTALIGTDCPALSAPRLAELLKQPQPGLIAATDGGYVAISMERVYPRAFAAVHWGSSVVLKQTLRNFRACAPVSMASEPLPDLDTPRDYLQQRQAGLIPRQALWRRSI